MMNYRCFYHFYDSIFPFFPVFGEIFQMDPRNTLILAGKNGTQFFSINRVSKNNLKQNINFSKQIPRDNILAPTTYSRIFWVAKNADTALVINSWNACPGLTRVTLRQTEIPSA